LSGSKRPLIGSTHRPFGLLVFVVLLLLLGRVAPVGEWLVAGSMQLRNAGVWGALGFFFAYALGAFLFVPAAMLTSVGGYAYGATWGALLAIPATAVSAFLVFLLSRTVLRKYIESWLGRDVRFVAVDTLLARFGARAVVLLRLSPVSPFSILNYGFGLTGIKSTHYFVATCIGTIPGSIFYAQLGAVAPHLGCIAEGRLPEGGYLQSISLIGGLVLTACVGLWLSILAKRALAATGTHSALGAGRTIPDTAAEPHADASPGTLHETRAR
jgi:uncharacterized membrane protein YdjX (TVP38/TMEM64 family)